ncbi:hypothetical protein DRE_00369 [Drechslerella stenobrocha 248]|uniref:Uncharacterized protein n=1 Tax=Drechslerella stenobrocha 248 TaxID=1043628 RepID=W7HTF1_9PEZI|nr:hypothetical protein DRE_00369 [Drechslerella stenobrocha 248]
MGKRHKLKHNVRQHQRHRPEEIHKHQASVDHIAGKPTEQARISILEYSAEHGNSSDESPISIAPPKTPLLDQLVDNEIIQTEPIVAAAQEPAEEEDIFDKIIEETVAEAAGESAADAIHQLVDEDPEDGIPSNSIADAAATAAAFEQPAHGFMSIPGDWESEPLEEIPIDEADDLEHETAPAETPKQQPALDGTLEPHTPALSGQLIDEPPIEVFAVEPLNLKKMSSAPDLIHSTLLEDPADDINKIFIPALEPAHVPVYAPARVEVREHAAAPVVPEPALTPGILSPPAHAGSVAKASPKTRRQQPSKPVLGSSELPLPAPIAVPSTSTALRKRPVAVAKAGEEGLATAAGGRGRRSSQLNIDGGKARSTLKVLWNRILDVFK